MYRQLVARTMFALSVWGNLAAAGVPAWLEAAAPPQDVVTREVEQFLLQRVPALEIPNSREAWLEYAAALRRQFLNEVVFDGVPEAWRASDLQVVWGATIDMGRYKIRKLRYEALPGLWIPALLYEPAGDARGLPAVLNVNGHVGPPGKASEYEQIRCINLAQRGMLALHPEWFACGELIGPEYSHGNIAYLDLLGVRGVSVFYLAIKRAVDVLDAHPRSDRTRLAMTGLSGGGWQTAFLSALDERIALIAPVAGYGSMTSRITAPPDLGDLEQAPIDLLTVADYSHLTALFAPRPALLTYNAKDECCFLPEHTLPGIYDAVLPVYQLFDAGHAFEYHINDDPGTHNYELDNRLQFYRFINEHFLDTDARIAEEIPYDGELFAPEDLYVGVPEGNVTLVSLAAQVLAQRERPPMPAAGDSGFGAWQARRRDLLSRLTKPLSMTFAVVSEERTAGNGIERTNYVLKSADWSMGAVYLEPQAATPGTLRLVFGDAGAAALEDTIARVLEQGDPVLVFDPLFMGRNNPHDPKNHTFAMAVNAAGERALGVQAGQIAALCQWARAAFEAETVQVHATGLNAALAALVACNSVPGAIDGIAIADVPDSLGLLIEERIPYSRFPAVYCYGLLKHFDIPDLAALCHPAAVVVASPRATPAPR
jgi:dienelactone hydrolase